MSNRAYAKAQVQQKTLIGSSPKSSLLQRTCACGQYTIAGGECEACRKTREGTMQRAVVSSAPVNVVPPVVHSVLSSPGQPLDAGTRTFMEPRFGHDFSQVRVHTDERAVESTRAVNALAYTVGKDVVFGAGQHAPGTSEGRKLLAHELTHVVQQASNTFQGITKISQPGDVHEQEANRVAEQVVQMRESILPYSINDDNPQVQMKLPENKLTIQRQAMDEEVNQTVQGQGEEEGIEVGDQLMMLPRWHVVALPVDTTLTLQQDGGVSMLQRQAAAGGEDCDIPQTVRKVTTGKFEGGKTLDDYFPDLVGKGYWGKNDTAGPFDNGSRAGSSVQLIGEYLSPCLGGGSQFTFGQTASFIRARANGKKLMEGGKPLEGQTIDDIKRSGRDQSKAPFRQTFDFAISMADPISGIVYAGLTSYEWEVDLTTSVSGKGGSKSVGWGVTVEASGGKVTKNVLR